MIKDKNILKGKNCFITGATGGLGTSISTELALSECNLFLTSTNKKKLEKLKKDLSKLNSNITIYSDVHSISFSYICLPIYVYSNVLNFPSIV